MTHHGGADEGQGLVEIRKVWRQRDYGDGARGNT